MQIPHKTFYFVRHGETNMNKMRLIMGSIDDALNETGIAQAEQAAQFLKGEPFDVIISSPRKRALQTAQIIAQNRALPLVIEENLTERVWGEAEGQSYDMHKSLFDDSHTPKGAESFSAFQKRVVQVITRMLSEQQWRVPLFVSHGGVFKAIVRSLGVPELSAMNGAPFLCRAPETQHWPWFLCSLSMTQNDEC